MAPTLTNAITQKSRDCTISIAKTKALISFAVTAKLICVFDFEYAKSRFSHNKAYIIFFKGPLTWLDTGIFMGAGPASAQWGSDKVNI